MHEADVVGAVIPDQRRARREGGFVRDDRRQRLVIDLDQLGGVLRLVQGLGDDKRDVITDPAHLVRDQRRKADLAGRLAALALEPTRRRQVVPA
jgi:hypothetical protein